MKKLFAIISAFIAFGVAFAGAGAVQSASYECVDSSNTGMNSNASFLAPIPVNLSMQSYLLPHEIWLGTSEFFQVIDK
ncbi:MAG: hypothetical protein J7J36_01230 [Thermoplasmata archaeon]|nr:hypothetical protein [Thermoplasmata archaeon]